MKDNQIRLALKGAKTECGHDTKPKDIVFRVLENAMQVDGNLPDRDGHFELRTLWPRYCVRAKSRPKPTRLFFIAC
jgi:hypothetical protein